MKKLPFVKSEFVSLNKFISQAIERGYVYLFIVAHRRNNKNHKAVFAFPDDARTMGYYVNKYSKDNLLMVGILADLLKQIPPGEEISDDVLIALMHQLVQAEKYEDAALIRNQLKKRKGKS
jgi:hypothetical protein